MKRVFFVDLETTGLNPRIHQTVELAIVEFSMGGIDYDNALHFYVDHKTLTFDTQALVKFGDRIRDRKPGVKIVNAQDVPSVVNIWMASHYVHGIYTTLNMGGKNFGSFDLGFIKEIFPGFERLVKHRSSDLGNKYEDRDDDHLPDLETCRKRAIKCGVEGRYVKEPVTHTALEDAALCAELYNGWWEGKLGTVKNPGWR